MPSLSILLRYSFTWRSDRKIKLYNIIAIIANVAIIDIDQLDIVDVPLQDQHWALSPPWPSPALLLVWNEIMMIVVCICACVHISRQVPQSTYIKVIFWINEWMPFNWALK